MAGMNCRRIPAAAGLPRGRGAAVTAGAGPAAGLGAAGERQ